MSPSSPTPRFIFRHSYWDGLLVLLSGLSIALMVGTLLNYESLTFMQIIILAFFYVYLQWLNYICISHAFIHTRFFKAKSLNTFFSLFNSIALGVPQSIYEVHHLNHHQYNHRSGDLGSMFLRPQTQGRPETFLSYSLKGPFRSGSKEKLALVVKAKLIPLAVIETLLTILYMALIISVSWRFFLFFYLPTSYLGQVLAIAQNYVEHYGAILQDPLRDSVSCYDPIYNFTCFNNGYHLEHHHHPKTHWTKIREVRALLPPDSQRKVVPYHHFFGLEGS